MNRDVKTAIEKISLTGSISIGECCKRTLKNWLKDLNKELIVGEYEWRVVGNMDNGCGVISCIPAFRYEAIKDLL